VPETHPRRLSSPKFVETQARTASGGSPAKIDDRVNDLTDAVRRQGKIDRLDVTQAGSTLCRRAPRAGAELLAFGQA
jgi:hypothetical protein